MSLDLVEKFVINRRTYGITATHECWVGGCRIYTGSDRADARKMLHTYATSQARAERGTGQTMVDNAQSALDKLGDDPFNLGRFRA